MTTQKAMPPAPAIIISNDPVSEAESVSAVSDAPSKLGSCGGGGEGAGEGGPGDGDELVEEGGGRSDSGKEGVGEG